VVHSKVDVRDKPVDFETELVQNRINGEFYVTVVNLSIPKRIPFTEI
jgi:hypothetical protein